MRDVCAEDEVTDGGSQKEEAKRLGLSLNTPE